jgi:hypothetical protein
MTADIRAELQPLFDALNARAALAAEPEPPADGEVAELVACLHKLARADWLSDETADILTRAADLLERLADSEPVGPSDEELTLVYAYAVTAVVDNKRGPFKPEEAEAAQLAGLRAVLARWGNQS